MSEQDSDDHEPYRRFLAADPRRRIDALEFGHDWRDDQARRYRVCWYQQTGELTAELLSTAEPLDLEDFHRGIATVQIIATIPTRAELDRLIGPWPQATPGHPHTLASLRQRAAHSRQLRVVGR